MNEKIVEKFLDSPGSALHILGSSFEQFIRFFHWYIYHQEFIFKPFHVEIIQKLEDIAFGRNKKRNLMINIPPRMGKLLADDTPVLTREGWKKHGDLKVGDYVVGLDGEFKKVLAVSPKAPANCCVEFSDGDKIYCHENHEWVIDAHPSRERIIRETKWFNTIKMYSGPKEKVRGHRYEYQLPMFNGVKGEVKFLPVQPYSLGAWLGDGTNVKPCITGDNNDYKIIDKMKLDGYNNHKIFVHKTTGVYTYYFDNLRKALNNAGLCYWNKTVRKFIPDVYFSASESQRLELLAGLLDTDGNLTKNENRYHFTTAEETLKDSFIKLVSTFGWRVNVIKQEPRLSSSGIMGKHAYWVISFNPDRYIPCQLERKQLTTFSKKRKIGFKSVTQGDFGKIGNCIEVEGGIYLVGYKMKPTHNSSIMKYFCAWSYMLNPASNCIYTSYSDDLVNNFSKDIREIVTSEAFVKFTGIKLNKAKIGADYWATEQGGGFRAAPLGGSLTGFGCGVSGEEYGGCALIDDPLKASNVKSQAEMQNCVDYYLNTLKSRANNQAKTPFILIMQRLALEDLAGYIIENEKDEWDIVKLPALNEDTGVALWEEKFSAKQLLRLKNQSPFVYYGQYQQEPIVIGGSVFKTEWFKYYNPEQPYEYQMSFVTSDTAQKKAESNDFTVFSWWGKTFDNKLHLLDMTWGKFDAHELKQQVKLFWEKCCNDKRAVQPYAFYIEEKGSGIGVIQELVKTYPLPLLPIMRNRYKNDKGMWVSMDKFSRAMTTIPYIANGWVYLPKDEKCDISNALLAEASAFKADLTHKHDDKVDTLCDAVEIAFGASSISSIFI